MSAGLMPALPMRVTVLDVEPSQGAQNGKVSPHMPTVAA